MAKQPSSQAQRQMTGKAVDDLTTDIVDPAPDDAVAAGRFEISSPAQRAGKKPLFHVLAKRSYECNLVLHAGEAKAVNISYSFTKGAVFPIYDQAVYDKLIQPSIDVVRKV